MKAIIIGQPGETDACERSFKDLEFDIEFCRPIAVEEIEKRFLRVGLEWVAPSAGRKLIDGIWFHAYRSRDVRARMSCFAAHLSCWALCEQIDEPLVILESDALLVRPTVLEPSKPHHFGMISLNDPRGATRKGEEYHAALQASKERICEVPWIDELHVPQGLPGHSAYLILPYFAAKLIRKAYEVGAMPNDALAIRQWFPTELGCVTKYLTKVSGRKSLLS